MSMAALMYWEFDLAVRYVCACVFIRHFDMKMSMSKARVSEIEKKEKNSFSKVSESARPEAIQKYILLLPTK